MLRDQEDHPVHLKTIASVCDKDIKQQMRGPQSKLAPINPISYSLLESHAKEAVFSPPISPSNLRRREIGRHHHPRRSYTTLTNIMAILYRDSTTMVLLCWGLLQSKRATPVTSTHDHSMKDHPAGLPSKYPNLLPMNRTSRLMCCRAPRG